MNTTDSIYPWAKHSIPASETNVYRIGDLLLAIKRAPKQRQVAHKHLEEADDEALSELR